MNFYTQKYTEVFPLNGEAHRAAAQLMTRLQLKETQRVIIGTDPNNLFVVLTWEGKSDVMHLFKNDYIERSHSGKKIYYHRLFLAGIECKNINDFKRKIREKELYGGDFPIETLRDLQ